MDTAVEQDSSENMAMGGLTYNLNILCAAPLIGLKRCVIFKGKIFHRYMVKSAFFRAKYCVLADITGLSKRNGAKLRELSLKTFRNWLIGYTLAGLVAWQH